LLDQSIAGFDSYRKSSSHICYDYLPFQQLRLQRFDGKSWIAFGGLLNDQ
jgi:hypothetical protein